MKIIQLILPLFSIPRSDKYITTRSDVSIRLGDPAASAALLPLVMENNQTSDLSFNLLFTITNSDYSL